ncbi:type II toxin-antitoxin system HicB family antitoxin [Stenotrophomonas sp. AB1(2024)]|uniref:type II toxin-antitoxin system HicB family antitoxin n=1 Tax=Stenotrophomonas sp. AB1(2024) TaxID=3132215 RepID=UPI00309B2736
MTWIISENRVDTFINACISTLMNCPHLYPVYIHHQQDCAYGAIVPDLPGVHSAADELTQLPQKIREATALMYDDGTTLPPPSLITAYLAEPQYQNGFWMLFDISPATRSSPAR